MRAIFAALGAILWLAGVCHAQSIFLQHERFLSATPVARWTGPYTGVTFGYGWADLEASRAFAEVPGEGSASIALSGFDASENSFNGGGTIGYNWYASAVVFGVETDLSYANHEHSTGALSFADVLTGGDSLTVSAEAGFQYMATFRARLGLLVTPDLLFYGTAGLAVAHSEASLDYTYDDGGGPVSGSLSDSTLSSGWTAGLGLEDQFAENVSMKVEYLYTRFEDTFEFSDTGARFGFDGEATTHIFRGGLNFHF